MRSVLVVDDSATVRRVLVSLVRGARKGFDQVYEADGPETAVRVFREKKPDVVFLDMMMAGDEMRNPDGNDAAGLAVLKTMLAERPEVPVVVVTGLSGAQPEVVEAISLGAVTVLRKPTQAEDVRRVLDHLKPDKGQMDYFA